MNKFLLALMTMLFVVGCASTGGGSAEGGGLPEIAAYDDEAVEALPDMVAAE
jgi:hypothetical protein